MESERWRDIPGYVDRYMVSEKGKVMNSRNGRILRQFPINGYLTVSLSNKPISHATKSVHSLVALAFLGERPLDDLGRPFVVNHKDGNKTNNSLENLEYLSTWDNTTHYHDVIKPLAKADKRS